MGKIKNIISRMRKPNHIVKGNIWIGNRDAQKKWNSENVTLTRAATMT